MLVGSPVPCLKITQLGVVAVQRLNDNVIIICVFCLFLATSPNASSELEQARPQTSGEEELQLQLALAMSREAAEQVHHVTECHPKTAA